MLRKRLDRVVGIDEELVGEDRHGEFDFYHFTLIQVRRPSSACRTESSSKSCLGPTDMSILQKLARHIKATRGRVYPLALIPLGSSPPLEGRPRDIRRPSSACRTESSSKSCLGPEDLSILQRLAGHIKALRGRCNPSARPSVRGLGK